MLIAALLVTTVWVQGGWRMVEGADGWGYAVPVCPMGLQTCVVVTTQHGGGALWWWRLLVCGAVSVAGCCGLCCLVQGCARTAWLVYKKGRPALPQQPKLYLEPKWLRY